MPYNNIYDIHVLQWLCYLLGSFCGVLITLIVTIIVKHQNKLKKIENEVLEIKKILENLPTEKSLKRNLLFLFRHFRNVCFKDVSYRRSSYMGDKYYEYDDYLNEDIFDIDDDLQK